MPPSPNPPNEFVLTVKIDRPNGTKSEHWFPISNQPELEFEAAILAFIMTLKLKGETDDGRKQYGKKKAL